MLIDPSLSAVVRIVKRYDPKQLSSLPPPALRFPTSHGEEAGHETK